MCNKNQIAIKILKIVKNTFVHFFVASIFRNVKFECMHTGSTGRIAYYHQGMCKQLTKGRKSETENEENRNLNSSPQLFSLSF